MGAADNNEAKGGAALGVLMLETRFPRLPGDIGNPASFDFPVLYATVAGADPETTVRGDARRLLPDFIAAGRELVAQGAAGLTESCGFLAPFQKELADGCGVLVAASSLLQIPPVQRLLPDGRQVGVLTADAEALGRGHRARNAPAGLRHAPPAALVPCRAGGRGRWPARLREAGSANPETQSGGPKPAALFPNERRRAPLLYGVPFQPWRALNLRTVLLIT